MSFLHYIKLGLLRRFMKIVILYFVIIRSMTVLKIIIYVSYGSSNRRNIPK